MRMVSKTDTNLRIILCRIMLCRVYQVKGAKRPLIILFLEFLPYQGNRCRRVQNSRLRRFILLLLAYIDLLLDGIRTGLLFLWPINRCRRSAASFCMSYSREDQIPGNSWTLRYAHSFETSKRRYPSLEIEYWNGRFGYHERVSSRW